MPLKPGKSKSVVSENIKEMVDSGHGQKQAVAASLHNADKYQEASTPGGGNAFVPDLGKKKKPYQEGDFMFMDDIPLFDAHSGREENLDVDFDEDLLQQIVDACNFRMEKTGDLTPVTDGHSSDDHQPDILGWAYDFKLKPFGKDNRPCIYACMKFHRDKWARAKELPRRSVELWPDMVLDPVVLKGDEQRKPMDSVALLGAERPARDLGLMNYSEKNNLKAKYSYELKGNHMNEEDVIKKCIEALSNLPELAWCREQMKSAEGQYAEEGVKEEPEVQAEQTGDGNDTQKEPHEEESMEPAKLRMQRDQERRKYSKLENEYRELYSKIAVLEKKERVAERKADLLSLEGEGFDFDLAEELEYVSDMEPARYGKHVSKIRKSYRKAPIGSNIKPAPIQAEGGFTEAIPDRKQVQETAVARAFEKYNSKK